MKYREKSERYEELIIIDIENVLEINRNECMIKHSSLSINEDQ